MIEYIILGALGLNLILLMIIIFKKNKNNNARKCGRGSCKSRFGREKHNYVRRFPRGWRLLKQIPCKADANVRSANEPN